MAIVLKPGDIWQFIQEKEKNYLIYFEILYEFKNIEGAAFDKYMTFGLDLFAFLIFRNQKVSGDSDLIFYNNIKHPSGSLIFIQDPASYDVINNSSVYFEGGILVDVEKIPVDVSKIVFTTSIFESDTTRQNLGELSKITLQIINFEGNTEIAQCDFSGLYSIESAAIFGELFQTKKGEWVFKVIGQGVTGGTEVLCNKYGIEVEK